MESTTTRIDSNLCSSNKIKVIIPLNSICSVKISPCFDDQNSSLYISCTHLIIMTWLFSKYSRHIKTRWIISWLNILTLTVQFHITFWQKKMETTWAHFTSLRGRMEALFSNYETTVFTSNYFQKNCFYFQFGFVIQLILNKEKSPKYAKWWKRLLYDPII